MLFIIAGLQVPVIGIAFVELEGNNGTGVVPVQKGAIGLNVGVMVSTQGTLQVIVWAGIHGSVACVIVNVADCPGNIPNTCQWEFPVFPVTTGPP